MFQAPVHLAGLRVCRDVEDRLRALPRLLGRAGQRHDPAVPGDERVDQPSVVGRGFTMGPGGA